MKVKITTTDGLLGTASANPEIYEEFLGKKSADKERVKEEIASLPQEDLVEKSTTVFHRDAEGNPILYDYQIRGFIKESLGTIVEFETIKIGSAKFSKWTFKRLVDNFIFVTPREIKINMKPGTKVGICTRPLRAETLRGPRVALAQSEEVPEGATLEFEISAPDNFGEYVKRALDMGANKGLGQWRNSGKGRFTWVEIA